MWQRMAKLEKRPPLWLFSIMEMPYGVISGVIRMLLPFLLRQSGLGLSRVGAIIALVSLPGTFCFLYAPIVDLWIRRRTWLISVASASAICCGAGIWFLRIASPGIVTTLFSSACAFAMLVSAATGGLMSALLHGQERARVGGWVQVGNLGAASMGDGLLLMLASRYGNQVLEVVAVVLIMSPALAALAVREPLPVRDETRYKAHLLIMARDFKQTFFCKRNLPAMLLLVSPIGSGAMSTLMGGLTREYGATLDQLAFARGYGVFLTPSQ
jgi:PAT family beta-lactamase induction signal transducer AmpG